MLLVISAALDCRSLHMGNWQGEVTTLIITNYESQSPFRTRIEESNISYRRIATLDHPKPLFFRHMGPVLAHGRSGIGRWAITPERCVNCSLYGSLPDHAGVHSSAGVRLYWVSFGGAPICRFNGYGGIRRVDHPFVHQRLPGVDFFQEFF
jgi:hypothetical protein